MKKRDGSGRQLGVYKKTTHRTAETGNNKSVNGALLTAQAVVIGIKGNNEYLLDDMLLAV